MRGPRWGVSFMVGVFGAVVGIVGLVAVGLPYAGAALMALALAVIVGARLESRHELGELLLFEPAELRTLVPTQCGIDQTDPWLLGLTSARDGRLLRLVSRRAVGPIDRALCQALREQRSVVVALEGEPKAGKSRCLFELLRYRLPEAVMYAPKASPRAARDLVTNNRFRARKGWKVLWLDDVEDMLGTRADPGVDDLLLERVLELPRVVVAITAGGGGGARQRHRDPTASTGLSCLQDAVWLDPLTVDSLDGDELTEVLGARLAAAIGPEGLGAACVAGRKLLRIHRTCEHPSFEGGARVAVGPIIVECLRAGDLVEKSATSRDQLFELFCQVADDHADAESFRRGLRWARTPIHGEVALVVGSDKSLRVNSYVNANAEPYGRYREVAERVLAASVEVDVLLPLADRAADRRDFDRARRLIELALERADDDRLRAALMSRAAAVQREIGEFARAQATYVRVLSIKERVYGPDDSEVAATLDDLGIVRLEAGELEQARATLERALSIKERVYGPDHYEVATTLDSLGKSQRLLNEFTRARDTLERALIIKERFHGPDHREAATTLHNLGAVQSELDELQPARVTLERALTIRERVHGPDHHEVAATLVNLAIVQRESGELEQARATLERALSIEERVYGPGDHEVAATLVNLAIVQRESGELEQARATLERALSIKERVYGPGHHKVAATLVNLGGVQLESGELEQARATLERALSIEERANGPDHHDVTTMLLNLAIVQRESGELEQARATLERALSAGESVYGPDHSVVALVAGNLGAVLLELGEPEQAETLVRRALAVFKGRLSDDHPHTRWARRVLAGSVARRGEVLVDVRDATAGTDERCRPSKQLEGSGGPLESRPAADLCRCGSGLPRSGCHPTA